MRYAKDCYTTSNVRPGVIEGLQRVTGDIYAPRAATYPAGASASLNGKQSVVEYKTLFDGKTLNADDPLIFENEGTGAATYAGSNVTLSVTAGQYMIRQQLFHNPYFSGKPQQIEQTCLGFQSQAGVVKRIGYFSSSTVARSSRCGLPHQPPI
jgi:hypothetical protein